MCLCCTFVSTHLLATCSLGERGQRERDTWLSESHRAARSFSLVKVNGRFFNLIERDTQRGGERGKVRKKKKNRDVSSPTHCTARRAYNHSNTLSHSHGNSRPNRNDHWKSLRSCVHCIYSLLSHKGAWSLRVCMCVCVGVPVVAEVKDSQFGHLSDLIRKKLQFIGPQWHDGHVLAVTDLKHTETQTVRLH